MSSVIVAGARTPIGRLLGGLSGLSSTELGAIAIRAALERSSVAADDVDAVLLGQVLTAGVGQLPARQAAVAAGISMTVPALTINKVCLSGLQAVVLADLYIRSGLATTVVAGGQESMSKAPHLHLDSRTGTKYGSVVLADSMELDGLWDAFTDRSMGALTEHADRDRPIERAALDRFAARSHRLAAAAQAEGRFDSEIVPVTVRRSRGDAIVVDRDEGVRADTTEAVLATLRPAFDDDGAITAGNASPVSDGACAMVVMDRDEAERRGLPWLAEIGAPGMVAGPDSTLQAQPANAILDACRREGIEPADLDLIEINEAFANVGLASIEQLGVDPERVNVDGGAIAVGHPLGMSGARLLLHLALALARRGGGVGAAALCGGGGQGDALILRVPERKAS